MNYFKLTHRFLTFPGDGRLFHSRTGPTVDSPTDTGHSKPCDDPWTQTEEDSADQECGESHSVSVQRLHLH